MEKVTIEFTEVDGDIVHYVVKIFFENGSSEYAGSARIGEPIDITKMTTE